MANFENVMMTVGRNVFAARHRRRLTQENLAKLIGMPRSTVARMESGKGNPSLQSLGTLSEALNISIDELLTPRKHPVWGYSGFETETEHHDNRRAKTTSLLPRELSSVKLRYIELEPSAEIRRSPDSNLSREFLTVLTGVLHLNIDDSTIPIRPDGPMQFRSDQPYVYENPSTSETVRAVSATLLVTLL